jgi:16S rRNA (cytosine1402-N4)-methyltransferase
MKTAPHTPVLLNEVVESFRGIKSGYFVDCTLGYGGHSEAILQQYQDIQHIGIDRDREALEFSKGRLEQFGYANG